MIPGPPPVMIEKPARPRTAGGSRAAFAYIGWSRGVRAEPKIETALPTCASRSNPACSSSWMRAARGVVELGDDRGGLGLEQLLVGGGRRARVRALELRLVLGVQPLSIRPE